MGGEFRYSLLLAGVMVAAAALVGNPGAAAAQAGVEVDLGAVAVDDALRAGQRYVLPQIGVRNPGSEATSYEMMVMPLEGTLNPPDGWIDFEPNRFDLEPGQTQAVRVVLQLPPDASPGDYETLLAARIAAGDSGGVAVGAAAASRLSFTVEPSTLIQGWLLAIGSFFSRNAPWTYIAAAVVGFGLIVLWIGRRFSFRVERKT